MPNFLATTRARSLKPLKYMQRIKIPAAVALTPSALRPFVESADTPSRFKMLMRSMISVSEREREREFYLCVDTQCTRSHIHAYVCTPSFKPQSKLRPTNKLDPYTHRTPLPSASEVLAWPCKNPCKPGTPRRDPLTSRSLPKPTKRL